MNTWTIKLDVGKRHVAQPPVIIAQGDKNATTIEARVYDGGALLTTSGLTAMFRMRLPDGQHYYAKAATWTAATGTLSVAIDETEAASYVGTTHEAYFEFLQGSTVVLSTTRFDVRVLRGATSGLAPAESYDGQVEALIETLGTAITNANTATTNATNATSSANTATSNANTATNAANAAAADAIAAAAEARGAIDPDMRIYLTYDQVGEIDYLSLVDTEEA